MAQSRRVFNSDPSVTSSLCTAGSLVVKETLNEEQRPLFSYCDYIMTGESKPSTAFCSFVLLHYFIHCKENVNKSPLKE